MTIEEREKRRARRIERFLFVKSKLAISVLWGESEATDISSTGIGIRGKHTFKPNDLLDLRFTLGGNLINCQLRVCRTARNFAAGYFTALRENDRQNLEKLLYT